MLARAGFIPLGYTHLGHTYPRERVRDLWLMPSHRGQRQVPLIPAPQVILSLGGVRAFRTDDRPLTFVVH